MLNSKKTDKEAYMMESFENNEFETESNDIPESPVEPLLPATANIAAAVPATGNPPTPIHPMR